MSAAAQATQSGQPKQLSVISKKSTPPVYVVVVEVTGACWIRDREAGVDSVVVGLGDAIVALMVL